MAARLNTSEDLLEEALRCERMAATIPWHDPAKAMYLRDADWFLTEAAKLEREGK